MKNNPKNSRTTHKDLAQVIFNDSISWNQELVSSVNKKASKVQSLFLPVTCFSDDKNKDNFLQNWRISCKWLLSLTVLPRTIFRTKSKVWWSFFGKIVNSF